MPEAADGLRSQQKLNYFSIDNRSPERIKFSSGDRNRQSNRVKFPACPHDRVPGVFNAGGPSFTPNGGQPMHASIRNAVDTLSALCRQYASNFLAGALLVGLTIGLGLCSARAAAQTAGEGAIEGTVTDSTGAVVSNAMVVATNNNTGVSTRQPTTSEGVYDLRPIIPGTYTVTISAAGF